MKPSHSSDFADTQGYLEIPPPIPAFSWMGSMSPLLIVPIVCVALIALFAPDNVLDRWPIAKGFTDWMMGKMPFIDRHANSTRYPQLALLVNCLTVFLVFALAAVWVLMGMVHYQYLLESHRVSKRLNKFIPINAHIFFIIVAVPLFVATLFFMVAIPGDPSWAEGFTTRRRGGLALMSCLTIYIVSFVVGGWPLMVRVFIDLYLRKED